MFYAIQLY